MRSESIDDSDPHAPVRAFALAPLAAPVTYFAAVLGVELVRASLPDLRSIGTVLAAVVAIGAPLAYAVALVAGLPVYLILRRLRCANRWTSWATGAALGAIVALLLAPTLRGDLFSIPFPWWLGASIGVVCAETFWRLLTSSKRPPRGLTP